VSIDDPATVYGLFTGRFSEPLAREFAGFVGPTPGKRVLDVGCGPGALTQVLAERLGVAGVCAVDPSEAYVAAARKRLPGVDIRYASAEDLPYAEGNFDAALAQLVVHFMADPVAGPREMARVTKVGGVVAAYVWDNARRGRTAVAAVRAAHDLDPATGQSPTAGAPQRNSGSATRQPPAVGRPRAGPYLPSAPGASKHQATALPSGQGVGRAAAFPRRPHALVANAEGQPRRIALNTVVTANDVLPPTGRQPP